MARPASVLENNNINGNEDGEPVMLVENNNVLENDDNIAFDNEDD
jgi:hypothetical protein